MADSSLHKGFVMRLSDGELAVIVSDESESPELRVSRTGKLADSEVTSPGKTTLVFPESDKVSEIVAELHRVPDVPGGGLDGRDTKARAELGLLLHLAYEIELTNGEERLESLTARQRIYDLIRELYVEVKCSVPLRDDVPIVTLEEPPSGHLVISSATAGAKQSFELE